MPSVPWEGSISRIPQLATADSSELRTWLRSMVGVGWNLPVFSPLTMDNVNYEFICPVNVTSASGLCVTRNGTDSQYGVLDQIPCLPISSIIKRTYVLKLCISPLILIAANDMEGEGQGNT